LTRINLLPPEKIKEKRGRAPAERSYLWLVIALPLIALLLMGFWWFSMNSQLNSKDEELQQKNAELADIQAKTAALQQYKERQDQIKQIETTVVQALSGRVYWARILNNVAIMCPLNVWLMSLNGTTSGTEGTVTFEARATQCPNRLLGGFFPGMLDYHPDFRPVAGWLDRMAQIEQFSRVWLSNAEPEFIGAIPEGTDPARVVTSATGNWVIRFSSTATLNMQTAAIGTPKTAAPATTPAPSTTPEEGEGGT
jgi:Tfp pilus assembly protein PilN